MIDMSGADLTLASPIGADLAGAYLQGVNLTKGRMCGADLTGAVLNSADLSFADFRSVPEIGTTRGLEPQQVKSARNWQNAYYDPELLRALGLPPDHNQKLVQQELQEDDREQRKKQGQSSRP